MRSELGGLGAGTATRSARAACCTAARSARRWRAAGSPTRWTWRWVAPVHRLCRLHAGVPRGRAAPVAELLPWQSCCWTCTLTAWLPMGLRGRCATWPTRACCPGPGGCWRPSRPGRWAASDVARSHSAVLALCAVLGAGRHSARQAAPRACSPALCSARGGCERAQDNPVSARSVWPIDSMC
jgi:hypothetical protein